MKKVLLISMPFGALERQALGLSILKAQLARDRIPCEISYLTFAFADLIGVEDYQWVSAELPHTIFAGEWTFTACLHGEDARRQRLYIRSVLQDQWRFDAAAIGRLLRIRSLAPLFIDHCVQRFRWEEYAVVGFTSTFEQNIASLALAHRIKDAHPDVTIVFGGANWEEEMGCALHASFPFVDYAFSGEADRSFPRFVRHVLDGGLSSRSVAAIPGLIRRSRGRTVMTRPAACVRNLDTLPIPDYSDYFQALRQSASGTAIYPSLLFEGSRGCWWGAKHPCKFCGLNGAGLHYRAKGPERALEEIDTQTRMWNIDLVQAVDNVVPMRYFSDVFPALAKKERPGRLFYEIRANLSRSQVKRLRDARVLMVQPGVESFSRRILQLMDKGTHPLQNVQVLKWCREYGVQAEYNILYGFPGETDEDYQRMLELLHAIRHLNPPTACGPVRLDRFSPYYREAEERGFCNVRPMLPYRFLYPFDEERVRTIAYYFDYDLRPGIGRSAQWDALRRYVETWRTREEKGTLQSFVRPDGVLVLLDSRGQRQRATAELRGVDRAVYEFCDRARPLAAVLGMLHRVMPGARFDSEAVRGFLDTLVDHGYMIRDEEQYLSIALSQTTVQEYHEEAQ